jgi:hypothetical protein
MFTARLGRLMKATALTVFLMTGLTRLGLSVAAPMADVARASPLQPRNAESFALRDGAHYYLGKKLALFADYKEMKPASGALSPLETGLPAMPPVRLGGFLVSVGIKYRFN